MSIFYRFIRFIQYYLNLKSIYLNYKLLPFNKAIYLPLNCASNVALRRLSGRIEIIGDLFFRGMIEIGYGDVTHIDKKSTRTVLDITGLLIFNGPAHIGHGSSIRVEGELNLGANFRITARSIIIAEKSIKFGKNCLLSWDVLLMDSDQHSIYNSANVCINEPMEIVIGDHVWIGCRSTILKGAQVNNNCVIGAGSLLSKNILGENQIIAGIPAKVIKENVTWS